MRPWIAEALRNSFRDLYSRPRLDFSRRTRDRRPPPELFLFWIDASFRFALAYAVSAASAHIECAIHTASASVRGACHPSPIRPRCISGPVSGGMYPGLVGRDDRRSRKNARRRNTASAAAAANASPAAEAPDLDDRSLYLNRELALLSFQRRVLEEAEDPTNPLLTS